MDTDDAAITGLTFGHDGIVATARGAYDEGIGRVGFLLVDLGSATAPAVVDRNDVEYAKPRTQVDEAWTSSAPLVRGGAYRAFFHVYDRTGVNLVAYDRRDFTWS